MTPAEVLSRLARAPSALRLRDRLVLADPGLIRFRSAVRGTLLIGSSFWLLFEFTRATHQPISIAFLSVIVTMMGSFAINEPRQRDQKITLLLLPFIACLGITLGLLIAQWHVLNLIVYLLLTFFAVYIRRIGPRGHALGMTAYYGYFCSIVFPLPKESLPIVIIALLLSGVLNFAIRLWIVPEAPVSIVRWTLHSYRIALREFLRTLAVDLEQGFEPERNLNLLRRYLTLLNELALNLHDALSPDRAGRNITGSKLRELQGEIFDLELAAQRVASSYLTLFYPEGSASQTAIADRLGTWLAPRLFDAIDRSSKAISIESVSFASELPPALIPKLNELISALNDLIERQEKIAPMIPNASIRIEAPSALIKIGRKQDEPLELLPTTRQAFQVSTATVIAIILGTFVSSTRWYWAPMTAFLLFSGNTRGENINRALHRVLGTVIGLLLGLSLSALFNGNTEVEMVLLFIAIFFGIYTLRSAYIWPTMWFTIMIAMFFGVLGLMTPELYKLRALETLIGAGAGALATLFIYPMSTSDSVRKALTRLLETENEILSKIADRSLLAHARRDRLHLVRQLERDLLALRTAAAPFIGKLSATRSSLLQSAVFDTTALVYYTRHLAIFLRDDLPTDDLEKILSSCGSLSSHARNAALKFERNELGPIAKELNSVEALSPAWVSVQHSLMRIEQLLNRISSYSANS